MRRARQLAVLVALAAVVAALPTSAQAITYKRASRIALKTLAPEQSRQPVVLFGLPRSLPSTARVFEPARGVSNPRRGRIGRRTYLFWLDQAPGALFQHPSVLLLVNARTGKIVRRERYLWWPLVNGRRPAFLASARAYGGKRYALYESPGVSASRSARQLPRSDLPVTAAQSGDALAKDCEVLMADRKDPLFEGSIAAHRAMAKRLGIPLLETESGLGLDRRLTELEKRGCNDVLISIVAHGWAPQNSANPRVSLFPSARGIIRPNQTDFEAPYLANIMADHPGLTYKLIIASCYGGRWIPPLENDRRLAGKIKVIVTAAGPDETAWAPRWSFGDPQPLFFEQGLLPAIIEQYTPDDAGSGQDGPEFAQAIVNAFDEGYATAAGRIITSSTPRIVDHVKGTIFVNLGIHGDFTYDADDQRAPWGTGKVVATDNGGGAPQTGFNGNTAEQGVEFGPYQPGTTVTLTPTPDRGKHFAGWDGACQGAGERCVLTNLFGAGRINAGAHFAVTTHILKVELNDYSLGIVDAANESWIQCGTAAGQSFNFCASRLTAQQTDEQLVHLRARAYTHDNVQRKFVSFEGCHHTLIDGGTDQQASCWVAMDGPHTIKATFANK